jgi:hypothetical protein
VRSWSQRSWRAAAWLLERTVKGTYRVGDESDPMDLERAVKEEAQAEMEAQWERKEKEWAANGARRFEGMWAERESGRVEEEA